ncbi:DEAD/DEAH box helicase family protein [Vampirovibrio sp.]|uniref:DEAD/DEAH box helicase family protein n=1 Tax=Vampirovibrio sp. TaxID=2717857 RepID=UPI003592F798
MSQFSFLQVEFAEIYEHARKAETLALSDPRSACFYARLTLEISVQWLYKHDGSLRSPYETNLSALIHEPTFRKLVGDGLVTKARIIKDLGNLAVHETKAVTPQRAVTSLRELFHFSYWLVHTYAKGQKPSPAIVFSPENLPQTEQVESKRLQEIAKRVEETRKAREAAEQERLKVEAERLSLESELKQLRDEIAKIKKANAATPDTHNYNEEQTRDAFIDLLLHEAGWPLDQGRDREFPVTGMPSNSGNGFVDYVLWGDDGRPLAVVEAKRTRRDARAGQRQAELYANCLEQQFGQRPVIYYTNGYEHWMWDDRRYPPRPVQGFYKKDELELLMQRRVTLRPLAPENIDPAIVERFYQTRAIRRVCEAFETDHDRKALLVMATGAGKTRTVIALSDLLMRANWARRILFLADRVALVNQATNAFKKFLPQVSPVNLVTDKTAQGRVYVSTYPTMMSLIDEMKSGTRRFGPGHFDLIIIDEAHRSIYRKYKAIFDYFDSLLVGLTATPRDESERDTYALFDLETGVPTDAYELDDAVKDGFLVPLKASSVPLKFQRQGITYDDLSQEEKEDWDAIEWDDDGNVPDRVEAAALNKWLFNKDTVDKVLKHLMTHGIKVAGGDRLGKTIIFAKNHDHAQFILERFDVNYKHFNGQFARVIDFQTEYAQSLIDDFSTADKNPHIAISVDMLDTGIDVPEVVNLVFFKIVRSPTKFWQMIGRGTRLCENLFGPGQHKQFFQIFDFCQNFEFFKQNPDLSQGSSNASLSQKLFIKRVELIEAIDGRERVEDSKLGEVRGEVAQRLRDEVTAMSLDNFVVRPQRLYVEKFQKQDVWENLGQNDRIELVENIAGLPSALVDDDLAAKQFDYLLLRTQLALLKAQSSFQKLKKQIIEIAGLLEELSNVPMVAAELELILEIQTDLYWQDVTVPMLETIRKRLRLLIKLIEVKRRQYIYTDFEDEIGISVEVEFKDVSVGTDMNRFRMKVRHFLRDYEAHPSIRKIKDNEQFSEADSVDLEHILIETGTAEAEEIHKIQAEGGLGLFMRELTGLNREAAKRAFDNFLNGRSLNANQIEFMNMVIDYLVERGTMAPKKLYESPFTDINALGVDGVFDHPDVAELVRVLDDVRRRAAA